MVRILVSGSRNEVNHQVIKEALKHIPKDTSNILMYGGCQGVDEQFRNHCSKLIDWNVILYEANWYSYGISAEQIRNQQMVDDNPEFGIFIHSEMSIGTYDCLRRYRRLGKPGIIWSPEDNRFNKL